VLLVAFQALVAFEPGDHGAAMPGELLRRRRTRLGHQVLVAVEERGFDLVCDLGGQISQHVGMLSRDIAARQRLPEGLGVRQRLGATLTPGGLFGRQMRGTGQHIRRRGAATLLVEFTQPVVDRRFETVQATVQAPQRMQHADRLGRSQRGDVTAQDHRQVCVRVVRHPGNLSNIRSTVNCCVELRRELVRSLLGAVPCRS
jgi:hypothetical protein